MYLTRLEFLRSEVTRVVDRGLQLGKTHEEETMAALDEIEDELAGVEECIVLLNHLLWG
jgi:hypothetical protein